VTIYRTDRSGAIRIVVDTATVPEGALAGGCTKYSGVGR